MIREHTVGHRTMRRVIGGFTDAVDLLLAALAFPLVILLVGVPIALVIRLLLELAAWF